MKTKIWSTKLSDQKKVTENGFLVAYGLTTDIDFSDPNRIAEALGKGVFEKDAVNWYCVSDDHVEFNPTYRVRVVLDEEQNKKLECIVDDFLKDLKKDEIYNRYSKQITGNANNATSSLHAVMVAGTLKNILFHHSWEKIYKEDVRGDLFADVLEKRSLKGQDLMDWK